ncbi:MAG: hypothetical protein HYS04_12895 [Acidobacteria bacterium]|nr:hypothetical protein [Acidobacteriota bacterium]
MKIESGVCRKEKMMRKLVLLALFGAIGLAAGAQIEGVLMDQMCSAKAIKGGQKAAAMHSRDCALMPDCVGSGYGVFTKDNRFLTFDAAGNQKAESALKASKKKDNLRVQVTGDVKGDAISVTDLKLL